MASDKTKLIFNPLTGSFDAVQSVDDLVEGPAVSTDNTVPRFDSTTGKLIQASGVTINDSDSMSGLAQLDVDNLRLDANTISSSDTNGNIVLSPDGTGEVQTTKSLILNADATQNLGAVTKQQLDAVSSTVQNFAWQDSVIDKDLTAPPGSPATGDRYLLGLDTAASDMTGAWATHDGEIAEYNGTSWDFTVVSDAGTHLIVVDESTVVYVFGGTTWTSQAYESTTASGFLSKSTFDIQLTNVNDNNIIVGNGSNVATALNTSSLGDILVDDATGLTYKAGSIVNDDVNASAAIAYSKLSLNDSIINADINSAAAIVYSKLNLSDSILNADINSAAAIAYSKLNLTTSILNGDINASAAIAYSKLNLATSIVNADIAVAAAVAHSKMAALTVSRAMVTDGSGVSSTSTTTATELGYVNGVTSSIQTQLNNKISADGSVDTHSDVDTTTSAPSTGEALIWDGSNWVPTALPGATYASATQVMTAYASTINNWASQGSISLAAGTWDIYIILTGTQGVGGVTVDAGIDTVTTNVSPGSKAIDYASTSINVGTGSSDNLVFIKENVVLGSTTTHYLKTRLDNTGASLGYRFFAKKVA